LKLVEASCISFQLGPKKILADVHLTVTRGEIVTLIGPNGAGKSTLVRIILGLISPTTGTVTLHPTIKIGYMPQKIQIESFLPLSVERFLKLAGNTPEIQTHFSEIVHEMGIEALLAHPIQMISGGELQRVLLARALLRQPELLVLDEPIQGVDVIGQAELYQRIVRIRDRLRCGILMVSHDLHLVMAGTDSVVCLNQHVCCSGRPEDVTRHPEFVSLFGKFVPKNVVAYTHQHHHRHD